MRVGEYFDGQPDLRADGDEADGDVSDEPGRTGAGKEREGAPSPSSLAFFPTPMESVEMAALASLGFGKPLIRRLANRARANGTGLEAELLADGSVSPQAYFAAMARFLRLPFLSAIDPAAVVDSDQMDVQLRRPNQLRMVHGRAAPQVAIVPEAARLAELAALLDRLPHLGRDLVVSTPAAIRKAVWTAGANRRASATVSGLFEARAAASARIVCSGTQGFVAGSLAVALLIALMLAPAATLPWLHVLLSFLYFGSLLLRAAALVHRDRQASWPQTKAAEAPIAENLPTYTVMVALYREAAVAAQIVRSLERLDWPRALLDIKLVCEADDHDTIAALEAVVPGPHFEIVAVPPCSPRTKPKALTYALCAARGEFLAVYDAEDRPHPQQLREAYGRFRRAPDTLACLQAPLIVTNANGSLFSALFAIEYAGLFRGLLPMLACHRLPLPLGGTSNHFRTTALHAVGGWDPFNVTEDADLGIRLYRNGYRSATLRRQTLEDAPTSLSVWLGQRTRWYKGWVQTWLVVMRQPVQQVRDMGWLGASVFHLMIGGMLISALLHPLILILAVAGIEALIEGAAATVLFDHPMIFIDAMNVLGSYTLFVLLGLRTMTDHEKRLIGWRWAAVPFYWMMTSLAAWRALNELWRRPFFWNKTPHAPVRPQ